MQRNSIAVAKVLAIVGFLVLLGTSYFLRGEVLALNRIRFSADEAKAEHEMKQLAKSYPDRLREHEVAQKNYELQLAHYREMLKLYQTNYDEYVRRLEDKFTPPQMPVKPSPPVPPKVTEQLAKINKAFRTRKLHYFELTAAFNWLSFVAAAVLTGSLLYLLLFDLAGARLIYLATLLLSFVFLIGPSFHSILSAIVGFLEAPSMH